MIYHCEYCNKDLDLKNGRQFGAHKTNCKFNPNRKAKIEKISIKNATKKIRTLTCKTCGANYEILISDKLYLSGKYSKYCSIRCSHSRKQKEETKKKISKKLVGRRYKSRVYFNICFECGILFSSATNRNTCSSKCMKSLISKKISRKNSGKNNPMYGRTPSHTKRIRYNGIIFKSTWEVKVATWLDANKVKWSYESFRIATPVGTYVPDFVLYSASGAIEKVVEVKGYLDNIAYQKIEHLKRCLLVPVELWQGDIIETL